MRPEFFLDRCLGRKIAQELRGKGWTVHLVADVFPDDGQETSDTDWIAHGISRGWALLTQDDRIRYRASELAALADGTRVPFCLSSAKLTAAAKVDRFIAAGDDIRRAIQRGGPAFCRVYEDRVERKWP
ncbi:PIN-like domain-containing protein [Marinitenerispora sediminis]|uniref:Toxin-antitoxin system, toxin component, PIN family protein n=1 Tax=Marinitenerispora sediminis TaxID=1931232 RepID=A0A368T4H8_9ACTN|nr:toxin-antitoxin system, toxin component, PIN family protein [Marinitenerispora sediminis]RCV49902.1 toxin-antitoxin system, toxin component, PIN family protein [Marinitenerispora sediminis]RCV54197.1 toxin-antitoxin system, toxin component, PIN family protein [Marinitenerispora sediminis]RCV58353.1 toxin-antitoxin system, toxin component, PIN family protein [Marinitenerispora sediminis]